MRSIRNACLLNTMARPVAVPLTCTVQFSARSAITGQVFTKPAVFNPPPGITAEYNTTTFPDTFKCVDRVDITLLSAAIPGDALTVSVVFDNFDYVARVTQ